MQKAQQVMTHTRMIRTVLLVALVLSVAGCADSFFSRPPEDQLTAGNFYNSEQDLQMATGVLYNQVWFDWNDKASFTIGDARAGNMHTTDNGYAQFTNFSITQANDRLNEAWRSLYIAINQANLTIQNVRNNSSESIPQEAKTKAIAEARFIRGYAYSYLAQLWGPVPIVTNTPELIDQPNRRRNLTEDVYQFAINDFEFAAENLPPTQDQPGRVTEWSAKGMLARIYHARAAFRGAGGSMNQEDLDQARMYAEDVIKNSGMSLRDDYGDLFLLEEEETNNRQESLFALQWTYTGNTWGTQNTTQAYFAASSKLTGFADGWGGGTGVQGWLIQAYDENDERRPETFMMDGDYYPELVTAEGGYTYEGGNYFGSATSIKKYVIGRPEDNDGRVGQMRTGIDTYMLRLAEVYLIYAQTILGNQESTSNPEALQYYNAVRKRAGLQPKTSITFMDIFMEKWKELCYEGQNWFQLVRWHYYEPDAAIAFIESQNRGYSTYYNQEGELIIEEPDNYTPVTVTDDQFSLPYPEADVLQNEDLMKEPVPYDFSEQESGEGSG